MSEEWRIWFGVLAFYLFMIFGFPRDTWREVFEVVSPPLQAFMKPYIGEWLEGKSYPDQPSKSSSLG